MALVASSMTLVLLEGCGGSPSAPVAPGAAAVAASSADTGADAAAANFGTDLIQNGGGELNKAGSDGNRNIPPSMWTRTGKLTVVKYGASGGFPMRTDPGPADRGANFLAGGAGAGAAHSSGTQTADVSWAASVIDAGHAQYVLSGYLGGYGDQADSARVDLTFLSASSAPLGNASIGPVTAAQRHNKTGLFSRASNGTVPAGTRSIKIVLSMKLKSGSFCDGYADNLSLKLNNASP